MSDYTTFLFARPSFAEGMGRILDFGNTLAEYNTSPSGEEADCRAFWADWAAIGCDLHHVKQAYDVEARPTVKAKSKGSR